MSIDNANIKQIRIKTISELALLDLNENRFLNFDSAKNSIQDACTRRSSIQFIKDFEQLVLDWCTDSNNNLFDHLMSVDRFEYDKDYIIDFFNSFSNSNIYESDPIILDSKIPSLITALDIDPPTQPERVEQTTYRIIRDTELSRKVKNENQYKCMLCGIALDFGNGKLYAEAHHVKPLGGIHNGPDTKDNIMCVCPNHHALLDYCAIELEANLLPTINIEYIVYHNSKVYKKLTD